MTHEYEIDRRLADLEEGVSITAGTLDTDAFYRRVKAQRAESARETPFLTVFGEFLNLARRSRKLSLEKVAEEVDLDVLSLSQIEAGKAVPEPRIVSLLAKILVIPAGRLMQLAGHTQLLDQNLSQAASAFAMRSKSKSKPLDDEEREALHEFMKALTSK
jgi:transcriptional regulator with XRE-family HTH domain